MRLKSYRYEVFPWTKVIHDRKNLDAAEKEARLKKSLLRGLRRSPKLTLEELAKKRRTSSATAMKIITKARCFKDLRESRALENKILNSLERHVAGFCIPNGCFNFRTHKVEKEVGASYGDVMKLVPNANTACFVKYENMILENIFKFYEPNRKYFEVQKFIRVFKVKASFLKYMLDKNNLHQEMLRATDIAKEYDADYKWVGLICMAMKNPLNMVNRSPDIIKVSRYVISKNPNIKQDLIDKVYLHK